MEIDNYFISIDGSPTPKKQLVADLLKQHNCKVAECVLIGDSINDFEAAQFNNISFMSYNNPDLELYSEFKLF
jgi:histidinol phosphatase-like enzyme